jgi:hypothetical protein
VNQREAILHTGNRTKAISRNKITRRRHLIAKSQEGDTSQQNRTNATSHSKIA